VVTKHLTISKSPDGVIRQFVVFQDGRVVNLLVSDNKTEIIGDWRKSPEPLEIDQLFVNLVNRIGEEGK
jgi:hypothetical protein